MKTMARQKGIKNFQEEYFKLKVLLPQLHIKLGTMRQFMEYLVQDGDCFKKLLCMFDSVRCVFVLFLIKIGAFILRFAFWARISSVFKYPISTAK